MIQPEEHPPGPTTLPARLAIGSRDTGAHSPPYVIAELSANHLGDKGRALEIVRAAAEAGADAVKFQHYTPESITISADHPDLRVSGGTLWDGRTLADLYAEAMTPWEWTEDLVAEARSVGLEWLSSPFSAEAVDFLDALEIPAFKIASFELVDLPLIRHAAATGRPLILSTGMATSEEIDQALRAAEAGGASGAALLRCNSAYPAPPEAMDLRAIPEMLRRWRVEVGLSDHSPGSVAAVTAVALGATIVEKHLTLRRSDGGPDSAFSAEPMELADLVKAVRTAHLTLGTARFGPSPAESASLAFRRSLRAVRPIAAGTTIGPDDVRSRRPAGGLPPDALDMVIGSVAVRDISIGAPITEDDIERPGD